MDTTVSFIKPVSGDCLTNKAGTLTKEGLLVTVRLLAPEALSLTVNGSPAQRVGEEWQAKVLLTAYRNTVTARAATGETKEATLFWLPRATDRYRLSLDDNIWFLQDIARHADVYRSIFENPYLALLREAHARYGTKIQANLFFETPRDGGFTLAEMPDTFKREFSQNADWLRFSFHAKAELPDKPYQNADYAQLERDVAAIKAEILRFAGEAAYNKTETTVHWGECNTDGLAALHAANVRLLAGYLNWNAKNDCGVVSYHLDRRAVENTDTYGIFWDAETDMIFSKIDVVLNSGTCESITERLDAAYDTHPQKGFWEFLMHEQYFYPDYKHYLPDFGKRILTALDWAEKKGLAPAFLSDTHLP